jgi:hypothetical protein
MLEGCILFIVALFLLYICSARLQEDRTTEVESYLLGKERDSILDSLSFLLP